MNNCGCNNGGCDKFGTSTANDINCTNTLPVDNGSIIPFSSGITQAETNIIFGSIRSSLIGFGTAITNIIINGNTIILPGGFPSEAFTVPREGKITAISAEFTTLSGVIFDFNTGTIRAQIFHAPIGSDIFTGTSASVDLSPPQVDPIVIGQISSASANILPPVLVSPGDRLLMVFYVGLRTGTSNQIIRGTASAGINIV